MENNENISPMQPGKRNAGKLSEEKLLAYLDGKLSGDEQHDVEHWLAEEGMEHDAIEGLGTMDRADRSHTINKLNHNLRKKTMRRRGAKKTTRTDSYILIAVFLILLLVAVAFLVIRYSR